MKTCKGCRFYTEEGTKETLCVRFPPQVVTFDQGNSIMGYEIKFMSRYPRVLENTCACGEFLIRRPDDGDAA
jgi:hypothetical protein